MRIKMTAKWIEGLHTGFAVSQESFFCCADGIIDNLLVNMLVVEQLLPVREKTTDVRC